jgi:hypothetical protein
MTAAVGRRQRMAAPVGSNPAISMAQLAGSGTLPAKSTAKRQGLLPPQTPNAPGPDPQPPDFGSACSPAMETDVIVPRARFPIP